MPLEFQDLNISFAQGVDTKSDPKQLQGKLLSLQNASLQAPGEIQKRDGFQTLASPSAGAVIATYQNELVSGDGTTLSSYVAESNTQSTKGNYSPLGLTINTIVRNTGTQSIPDSAYHASGLECFVWINTLSSTTTLQYLVRDAVTGAVIVSQANVSTTAVKGKVLVVGSNFVIVYYEPTGTLFYKAIALSTPTSLGSAVTIATDVNTSIPSYDASVALNGNLYVGYRKGTTQIAFYSLSPTLSLSSQFVVTTGDAVNGGVALTTDASNNVWFGYGTSGVGPNGNIRGLVVNSALTSTVLAVTTVEANFNTANLTVIVSGTTATFYYECTSNAPLADYIRSNTLTLAGTPGTAVSVMRQVGLASKAFRYQSTNYFLVLYAGQYQINSNNVTALTSLQPTYFLMAHGASTLGIVGKLSPQLASKSYFTSALLPEFNQVASGVYSVSYLTQENLSTTTNGVDTTLIGVNRAFFNFKQLPPAKLEFATNLHLSGGQLTLYDGANVVEQGFHVFPENIALANTGLANPSPSGGGIGNSHNHSSSVPNQMQYVAVYEWIDNQGQLHRSAPSLPTTVTIFDPTALTISADLAISLVGQAQFINISSTDWAKLYVGQIVTHANLPAGTSISAKFSTAGPAFGVALSEPATASASGTSFTTKDIYTVKITVPTLSVTAKQNVTISLYRTQNLGTIFFRTGQSVVYNDPTVDSIDITDVTPDLALVDPLYTTGGELENIAPGAISAMATYKNRIVYATPEAPLTWGFSKQVVAGFPAEFTDTFVENVDSRIGQVSALGVLDDKLILFGPKNKYLVVGDGPAPSGVNNDFSEAVKITGSTGCTNQASVLELPVGLIYQDPTRGIWLLDRSLSEQYIGAAVEAYNSQTVTSAQLVPGKTQARLTLNSTTVLVLDYSTMQWETDLYPSAAVDSTIFQNKFTYITAAGGVNQQTPGTFTDGASFIPMGFKTGWLNLAGLQNFMRVREMMLFGAYKSPHTLTVNIYTDFVSTPVQTVTIPVTSDPGLYQFRVAMKVQKCESVQIEVIETQSGSFGEGFSFSGIAFRVGVKTGLTNVRDVQSF